MNAAPVQSALEPAGPAADAVHAIWLVMLIGGGLILAVVTALALYVLIGRRDGPPRPLGGRALIVGGGLAFPVVALTALLLWTLPVLARLAARAPEAALRVQVVGKLWWWEVRYLRPDGTTLFATANELRLPVGRPVELILTSDNVIHSFWAPALAGKMDLVPGHVNRLTVRADRAGTFRAQCAEFCGAQHAWMALDVLVLPPAELEAWVTAQTRPPPAPAIPFLAKGQQLFVQQGCGACHHVRGLTGAPGGIGPDLSNVGDRATIGAGLLPTTVGSLAGWIANPQALKPGTLMPAFDQLPGEDLRALAAWLASLE